MIPGERYAVPAIAVNGHIPSQFALLKLLSDNLGQPYLDNLYRTHFRRPVYDQIMGTRL